MPSQPLRTAALTATASALLAAGLILTAAAGGPAAASDPPERHALVMYGEPKYPPDFAHFDYADPDAPKGGAVVLEASGTYDSFNHLIVKGAPAAGIGMIYDSLMTSAADEAFSRYPGLARSVVMPADRSWIRFNLDPDARWHDGRPVTPEDVVWTFETLRTQGRSFHRSYYRDIRSVEKTGPHQVTFRFAGGTNRELPLIVGEAVILPRHYWDGRDFAKVTLEPPLGSGPYRITGFEPGRSVTYERVKDYWAAARPFSRGRHNFDRIRFEYYRDRDVATEAFKGGAFDFRVENSSKRWATAYDFPAARAGQVILEELPHERVSGMQGFAFNTRRPLFADRRVREALGLAWDFEWTNKTLMYGAYVRNDSYFANSELAAAGLPQGAELALLEPWRGQVPEAVFTTPYRPPSTDGSGRNRANLRRALVLLRQAGWTVRDGKLRNAEGEPFAFELLIVAPSMERIALPFARMLEKLGIDMSVRLVDSSQYRSRLDSFDFDMVVAGFGQSISPGNEQRDFWHSSKANVEGSLNLMGIRDPAVDALIEQVIAAPDRAALIAAVRALDRVLLWGHYLIPHFHIRHERIAYWNRFSRPAVRPRYDTGFPSTWWIDPDKQARLEAWRAKGGD